MQRWMARYTLSLVAVVAVEVLLVVQSVVGWFDFARQDEAARIACPIYATVFVSTFLAQTVAMAVRCRILLLCSRKEMIACLASALMGWVPSLVLFHPAHLNENNICQFPTLKNSQLSVPLALLVAVPFMFLLRRLWRHMAQNVAALRWLVWSSVFSMLHGVTITILSAFDDRRSLAARIASAALPIVDGVATICMTAVLLRLQRSSRRR
eukprot:TRINITY_DN19949_c0_g1_i1.p2 TRINITY_DN19949_c0_g1~~TRINITY_DN19949_c0_g1_i1.p2  ORF type:complete len:241 (+),score=85.95 TRINITY_DN19949_c0_g1_i1:94-723(+)